MLVYYCFDTISTFFLMTNLQLYLCMFCSFSFSSGTLWAFLLYCSSSVLTQIYSLFNISSCINDSHWSTMYRWVVWPKTWFLNPLYFFSEKGNSSHLFVMLHMLIVNYPSLYYLVLPTQPSSSITRLKDAKILKHSSFIYILLGT